MKRIFYVLIFLIFAVGIFHFGNRFFKQADKIQEILEQSPAIEKIKKEIFTAGPLRGNILPTTSVLTAQGIITSTNSHRTQNGLTALRVNSRLSQAAQEKIKDMFSQQYFEHVSPQGIGPGDIISTQNYEYIIVGENLALGNYKNDAELVQAWMNSPGHRANILQAKFTEIGVAVQKGVFEGQTTWLAVQEFGRPASDCPAVENYFKAQLESYQVELNILEQEITAKRLELDSIDPSSQGMSGFYNHQVKEYNALVKIYNNKIDLLKQLTKQYNLQVQAYNACLEK